MEFLYNNNQIKNSQKTGNDCKEFNQIIAYQILDYVI